MPRALLALSLAALVGCVPTADLRVPLAEPEPQSGRLTVVRVGDLTISEEEEAELDGYRAAFWDDLRAELTERYGFSAVEVIDVPDLAFDTLHVLVQNPTVGGKGRGWGRRPTRLPRDPAALAPGADVVVVLDRPTMARLQRSNSVYVSGRGFGAVIPLPAGQGLGVGADLVVYRAGQPAPHGVGRIDVYGRGGGLFENRVDDRSAGRTVAGVADRIASHGGFAAR